MNNQNSINLMMACSSKPKGRPWKKYRPPVYEIMDPSQVSITPSSCSKRRGEDLEEVNPKKRKVAIPNGNLPVKKRRLPVAKPVKKMPPPPKTPSLSPTTSKISSMAEDEDIGNDEFDIALHNILTSLGMKCIRPN